jgi:hypothetical protein
MSAVRHLHLDHQAKSAGLEVAICRSRGISCPCGLDSACPSGILKATGWECFCWLRQRTNLSQRLIGRWPYKTGSDLPLAEERPRLVIFPKGCDDLFSLAYSVDEPGSLNDYDSSLHLELSSDFKVGSRSYPQNANFIFTVNHL